MPSCRATSVQRLAEGLTAVAVDLDVALFGFPEQLVDPFGAVPLLPKRRDKLGDDPLEVDVVLPERVIRVDEVPLIGNWVDTTLTTLHARFLLDGMGVTFYFGGTSLLIVVGVAMDTINQVEAQLIMRHYEGFTPRSGRIRGRRSSF